MKIAEDFDSRKIIKSIIPAIINILGLVGCKLDINPEADIKRYKFDKRGEFCSVACGSSL